MNRKIIIFASVLAGIFLLMVLLPVNFSTQKETLFVIERGEGSKDIARNLKSEGFIWWDHLFRAYLLTRGISEKMQAGTYEISPSMSTLMIAEKFAKGDIAIQTVTIPEGFTAEQIYSKLQNLKGSGFINMAELKQHEGYLFPDTYKIPYEWTITQVVKMMTDNFDKKTEDLEITPEIVVMASILEKELPSQTDKEIAAGLLWKRIKVGMPLQVDAYLWTYENRGLPEAPISNPGLNSILAALNPKESPYWYYLSTPEGKTIFSKTLEEHNLARAKYLK